MYGLLMIAGFFTMIAFFMLRIADKMLTHLNDLKIRREKSVKIVRFKFLFPHRKNGKDTILRFIFVYQTLFCVFTFLAIAILGLHLMTGADSLLMASVALFYLNSIIAIRTIIKFARTPEEIKIDATVIKFEFLIKDHGFMCTYQDFRDDRGGLKFYTHSYYNENGCFTICHLSAQKSEYYYAKKFSNIFEELCESAIDIKSIGHEVWTEREKKFLWKNHHELILADVIRSKIKERGEFFGIRIK